MSIDVHVIITGICALLTSGGLPTDVMLPADPSASSPKHVAWLLMDTVSLADPNLPMFEKHKNDPRDNFRFVRLDNERITFGPPPNDKSVARIDGVPPDPENPPDDTTTMSLMYWVADMHEVAPLAKLKSTIDVASIAHVPGGIFSTNYVEHDCVWQFRPAPAHKYVQALAQEVDWNFGVSGNDFKIVLTKFDGSGAREIKFKTGLKELYITLGNTPEEDIVTPENALSCDPKETDDYHFGLYYELFNPLTARPIPHKKGVPLSPALMKIFARQANLFSETTTAKSSERTGPTVRSSTGRTGPSGTPGATPQTIGPPRRGAGSNCPPSLVEGSLTKVTVQ